MGSLFIAEEDGYIVEISFMDADTRRKFSAAVTDSKLHTAAADKGMISNSAVLDACIRELEAYFAGTLREFTVPIRLTGTDFRMKVWAELMLIPYGTTISYKDLALRIGQPSAMRAVGGANHHNPVSIIVPCHRVVGASGTLTGYGGGLGNKAFLLELEAGQL